MTDAWDRAADMADKHANEGGIFVKLAEDGDKVVGAFVGDPQPREVVWTGEAYEPYEESKHKGKRPSLRVQLNFYVPTERTMKVIELNGSTFKDLLKLRDKYGLDIWTFEIERHGAKGDPKTKYSMLPEDKIDGTLRAEIDAAERHDLANLGSDDEQGSGDGAITESDAEKLMAALRRLPKSAVQTFLTEMKVQRIRDVRVSDLRRAHEIIGKLEPKQAAAPQAEVDPFA